MKNLILSVSILLLLAGSVYESAQAINCYGDGQENPFVGVWEPAPNQGQVFIKSLWINEDSTFAAEMTAGRKDIKGTYTIKEGKLKLEAEELKRSREELSATITEDGRLKLTKGDEEQRERSSIYFIKK